MTSPSAPPTRIATFSFGKHSFAADYRLSGMSRFSSPGSTPGATAALDDVQPIALYIYFSLLLVLLQLAISEVRSWPRILLISSSPWLFAIIYAGERLFNAEGKKPGNFTSSAWTYIMINALLLIVFVVDAIDRRRASKSASSGHL